MNASQLAQKMLEWEEKSQALEALEDEIKQAVTSLGKSFVVGNVRATFTKGRTTTNYEKAANAAMAGDPKLLEELIIANSRQLVDWKMVYLAVEHPGFAIERYQTVTDPYVIIKSQKPGDGMLNDQG